MGTWGVALADGGAVRVHTTDRSDGDLRVDGDGPTLAARRAAVVDRPWVWLRQVHGADVVVLAEGDDPAAVAGTAADAVVTTRADLALAVHGADCGIVGLWSPEGVLGAAHAGWRGLRAGVVGAAVDAMRALGATAVAAVAGPCIGPECYEFGAAELDEVSATVGPGVRATTAAGTPALDLPAALGLALAGAGAELVAPPGPCTACAAGRLWSHRARGEAGRQALVVWREAPG